MTSARHRVAVAALATAACLMLAGCFGSGGLGWSSAGQVGMTTPPPPVLPPAVSVPVSKVLQPGDGVPIGIYEAGFPRNTSAIDTFSSVTGVRPRLLAYYSGWGTAFATSFAETAHADGAVPVVKLEPLNVPLTSIIAGQSDTYLRKYAQAVRAYHYSVILSFGHEMNGTWYSWGDTHSKPADFVAAWRHVVQVFRAAGATNVKWAWTVNGVASPSANLQQWWPGGQWVDVVGIDGYYYTGNDTFDRVFGPTLTALRQFTNAPVLIAETAVGGGNPHRETEIRGLLTGAKDNNIFGIIWFDVAQDDGRYHQNWNLEADPVATAAFKDAVTSS